MTVFEFEMIIFVFVVGMSEEKKEKWPEIKKQRWTDKQTNTEIFKV